jgi:hypothetical protein
VPHVHRRVRGVQPGNFGTQLADLGDQGLGLSHGASITALTPHTVEDQQSAAATVAKPLDGARRTWTTLEYRPSPRPVTDGPGRLAHSYGSDAPRGRRVPDRAVIGQPFGHWFTDVAASSGLAKVPSRRSPDVEQHPDAGHVP